MTRIEHVSLQIEPGRSNRTELHRMLEKFVDWVYELRDKCFVWHNAVHLIQTVSAMHGRPLRVNESPARLYNCKRCGPARGQPGALGQRAFKGRKLGFLAAPIQYAEVVMGVCKHLGGAGIKILQLELKAVRKSI